MKDKSQNAAHQEFIRLLEKNKSLNISYSQSGRIAGFKDSFIRNVMHNRSTAKKSHVEQLLKAFPNLDPANKDETIKEQLNRVDKEMEDLKKQFAEQQAIWDEKSKILEIAKALADQLGKENE